MERSHEHCALCWAVEEGAGASLIATTLRAGTRRDDCGCGRDSEGGGKARTKGVCEGVRVVLRQEDSCCESLERCGCCDGG